MYLGGVRLGWVIQSYDLYAEREAYSTNGVRVPIFAPFISGHAIVACTRRNIMMAPLVVYKSQRCLSDLGNNFG